MQVQSLAWEDPLEKGNGNPLQHSCLGNPMDGVAFQAPPGSQASSRGEAKDSALLSSRTGPLLMATGESIHLRGLEGFSSLPGAPQPGSSLRGRGDLTTEELPGCGLCRAKAGTLLYQQRSV